MQLKRLWNVGAHLRPTLAALALLALPSIAHAQTGVISGRVTAGSTATPLADARVIIVGTSANAVTNQEGRYIFRTVPPGTVTIQVLRVGYQGQKKSVTLAPNGSATVDFGLEQAVVQLQEIVTTATGEQRRVEIGNSVATLGDINNKVETTPITNLADLMVAKAPGVSVLPGNMTGSAPVVRIRGLNSLSLSNAPIYVIDGVRMNAGAINNGVGGTQSSFLNDLSPEEIEDIEIVKGPSAATLYGTDAANGVIVITTKKGRAGSTKWTWYGELGSVDDRNHYPTQYAMWGHTSSTVATAKRCTLNTIAAGTCFFDFTKDSITSANLLAGEFNKDGTLNTVASGDIAGVSPVHAGHRDEYGMTANGGSDAVRFFISGALENEIGPLKMPAFGQAFFDSVGTPVRDEWLYPEAFQRDNFRTNLSASLTPKFDLTMTAGFSNTNQRIPEVDNNTFSYLYNAFQNPGFNPGNATFDASGNPIARLGYTDVGGLGEDLHGYGFYTPAQLFQVLTTQGIQRFIGSADASWRPLQWMQNEGSAGLDLADRNNFDICRFNECPAAGTTRQGFVDDAQSNNRNFSAKLTSTSTWQARADLNFKTTLGGDYNNLENDQASASGSNLPPGAQNVQNSATKSGSSTLQTVNKTLGLYAQEQASIRDRLFLTAAVRTDQNSAFGTNFQRVFYPKLHASWIVSDEGFFPKFDFLNQLRLRMAYGASGVQPGATSSLRTFAAATNNQPSTIGAATGADTPGLLASALGNPDLKPETSSELETGFESRLFSNRINVDFTYYNKKTKDALISQPIAASSGASSLTVLRNLGSVQNTGLELTVTATILDTRNFGWDMTVGGSHNSNKILSLGLDAAGNPNPTIGTGTTRDSLGLPVNGFFLHPFTFQDENNDGIITSAGCSGTSAPLTATGAGGLPCEVSVDGSFAYMGYSSPRDIVSIQSGFDLLQRKVRLQALLDYKGGYSLFNQSTQFYCSQTNTCFDETHRETSLFNQARLIATRFASPTTSAGYIDNGQFWRLREVSATVTLPSRVATQIKARDASLTLSGRNLHVWTKYTGTDPEANYSQTDVQTDFSTTAPPTYFIVRLNLHY